MPLVEIPFAQGTLLIGPAVGFPPALGQVDDASRSERMLGAVWNRSPATAALRRQWRKLFPGAELAHLSDAQLRRQLDAAVRARRIRAVFLTSRALDIAAPRSAEQDHRVLHLDLPGKTVLVAHKGHLPGSLGEPIHAKEVAALLRETSVRKAHASSIVRQAHRVLKGPANGGQAGRVSQAIAAQLDYGRLDAAILDKPALIRQAAILPSAPRPVGLMTAEDKVLEAIKRVASYKTLLGAAAETIVALVLARAALWVVALLALMAAQAAPGVNAAIDATVAWFAYRAGGIAMIMALGLLVQATWLAATARSEEELDEAARRYAEAFVAIVAIGPKALGKLRQGLFQRGAATAEVEAASAAKSKAPVSSKKVPREASASTAAADPKPVPKPPAPKSPVEAVKEKAEPLYSLVPESYMKAGAEIDMRLAPASSALNAAGFPRNAPWFWREMAKSNPEYFDASNLARIAAKRSPIVNEKWVENFPSHQKFIGEVLHHHHIDQGAMATPLPKTIHEAWSKALHPGN